MKVYQDPAGKIGLGFHPFICSFPLLRGPELVQTLQTQETYFLETEITLPDFLFDVKQKDDREMLKLFEVHCIHQRRVMILWLWWLHMHGVCVQSKNVWRCLDRLIDQQTVLQNLTLSHVTPGGPGGQRLNPLEPDPQ